MEEVGCLIDLFFDIVLEFGAPSGFVVVVLVNRAYEGSPIFVCSSASKLLWPSTIIDSRFSNVGVCGKGFLHYICDSKLLIITLSRHWDRIQLSRMRRCGGGEGGFHIPRALSLSLSHDFSLR